MNSSHVIAVFSGFNQRSVIAFLRTLEMHEIKYAIIACSNADTILDTIYRKNVIAVRRSLNIYLDDLLNSLKAIQIKMKADKIIIAPSTEALNRYILDYRQYFEDIGCLIPLVDKNLYLTISDKYYFSQLCNDFGINTPKELNENLEKHLPLVAKPKKYFSERTGDPLCPIIISSRSELVKFHSAYVRDDFYFQEYIKGKCFYLLFYFYKDGSIRKFSQENLVQQPDGKSIIAAVSSDFHNDNEVTKYENLFKSLNFHGFLMVEIKTYGEQNYMIEANPRFWGPAQLFIDAGINLFDDFLTEYHLIKKIHQKNIRQARYFWYGGIFFTRRNKPLVFHNYNRNKFCRDLPDWLSSDVYRRPDTLKIFSKEACF